VSRRIQELYGRDTRDLTANWSSLAADAVCPFTGKRCAKFRKSAPGITIGTCIVGPGLFQRPLMICPHRMLEKRRIFADAVHLLTVHEPGNDLHVVSEYSIPGGSVDYMLVSARKGKAVDFVGIEIQTLDTTGTVWPARERFMQSVGVPADEVAVRATSPFGVNWKMSAKTILVQLHHKLATFEHVNRKLVLALQDDLLNYMRGEFSFGHLCSPASAGDPLHFHAYTIDDVGSRLEISLSERVSTDEAGMARALGLLATPNVELVEVLAGLQAKLNDSNRIALA